MRPTAAGSAWRTVHLQGRDASETWCTSLYSNRNTRRAARVRSPTGRRRSGRNGTTGLGQNAWSHLALTYDGTNLRLFVNGTQVALTVTAGNIAISTGLLRIGGNSIWGEWFQGPSTRSASTAGRSARPRSSTDMNTSVGVPDTEPPSAPTNLQKTGATPTSISTSWTASTDNVGVAGYRLFRATIEVGTTTTTNFTFGALTCGTSHDTRSRPTTSRTACLRARR